MADLKHVDEAALLSRLAEAAARGQQGITSTLAEAVEELGTAGRAMATMPKTTGDLIERATICLVREIDTQQYGYGGDNISLDVDVLLGGSYSQPFTRGEDRPTIHPGRYRAIFLLLPLDKEKP